jgi:hypothetical protein
LKSADVEAELSQPLIDQGRLILPAGTHLRGTVLQVRPARRLHRNGQLRITFREVVLPNGTVHTVDTRLQGIQSDAADNAQLDSEGGTKSTDSKTRYLTTGASVGLALIGSGGRDDVGDAAPAAGGAVGFKLIGLVVGLTFRSHTYGILMSAYGGGRSIYNNFLGMGRSRSLFCQSKSPSVHRDIPTKHRCRRARIQLSASTARFIHIKEGR